MLKTCSVCGQIHDHNKICTRQSRKKETKANKFRRTYKWQQKSQRIKIRDKFLCRVCLSGKYDTDYVYNYKQLEVHHIIPIEEDYEKRLDSSNLITLCCYHHKMAEDGAIPRDELQNHIDNIDTPYPLRGRRRNKTKTTQPHTSTQTETLHEFFGKEET